MVLLISIFGSTVSFAVTEEYGLKRYAIITASNDGGPGRLPLKYAITDALAVSKVFEELGGLDKRNRMFLLEPEVDDFTLIFESFRNKLKNDAKSSRIELIFYYSGHSDDKGLLLKDGRYTYQKLRDELKSINVDVQLVVLDSCEAGSFTQSKGGIKRLPLLGRKSNKVKGRVFLTSSSANEAAQEADSIGGSFFTHYLVSAMRGAADVTGDKRITLNEAYKYAYQETLARTVYTRAGAQHPTYDIQLNGVGDLILTDLRRSTSSFLLPKKLKGHVFIRDSLERLVVEYKKRPGQIIEVALPTDRYTLTVNQGERIFRKRILLAKNEQHSFDLQGATEIDPEDTRSRGADSTGIKLFLKNFFSLSGNAMSVGYHQQKLAFNYRDRNYAQNDYNGVYSGLSLSLLHSFSNKNALVFDFYRTYAKGEINGAGISYLRTFSPHLFFRKNRISFYAGAGVFFESLEGYVSDEYDVPINSSLLVRSTVSSYQFPIGIVYKNKQVRYDLGLYLRNKSVNDFEKRAVSVNPALNLKVGYYFE